jgi:hypothetical protein
VTLRGDVRGRRIAVVPDSVVNTPPGSSDLLVRLAAQGWGVMALSPPGIGPTESADLLDLVVEQVITFIDDGYDVALLRRDDPAVLEFVTALQATGRTVTRVIELDPE